MSRGFPSMTALLGLVAVAGYQNRDKIAEWLGGTAQNRPSGAAAPHGDAPPQGDKESGGLAGVLEHLRGSLAGSAGQGGILEGGLRELVDRFAETGQAETADSWVRTGPNKPVEPAELERAIGPETLNTLSQQTGLSRQELLARLSRDLPEAVDKYTPQGRLPAEAEPDG